VTRYAQSIANLEKANAANKARWVYGVWACAQCGAEKPATAHQQRQTYCSKPCMAAAYRIRMLGEANPNAGTGQYTCAACSVSFKSYNKRKFCSQACYHGTKPAPQRQPRQKKLKQQLTLRLVKPTPPPKPPRPSGRVMRDCGNCRQPFEGYRSIPRLYCSYGCFTASGGPFRAGMAAAKAKMKYGAKRDANHNELMAEIRRHCTAHDLSAAGCGIPDGMAWVGGAWHLFDIKNPRTGYGRRGLNTVQKKWVAQAKGGPVYLIYTLEEAQRFGRGEFDGLRKHVADEEVSA
jgi:hypothetical protein